MATRATWKGMLSFGLVNIPIALHGASEDKGVKFNQLHKGCGGRVKLPKVCGDCGEVLPSDEIVKGFERSKDEYVVMEDADFEALPEAARKQVAVSQFFDATEVAPEWGDKSYYVYPEDTGATGYALILESMTDRNVVGLGSIVFREGKAHPVLVRPHGGFLLLQTIHWPDEIREVNDFTLPEVEPKMLETACQLIDGMTKDFDPAEVRDHYREQLLARIEAKATGVAPPEVEAAPVARITDLMATLKASVAEVEAAKPAKIKRTSSKRTTAKKAS